jgi:putative transposase
MTLMRFQAGTEVSIDGKSYRFVNFIDVREPGHTPSWFLRRLDGHGTELFTVASLRRLYDDGQLKRLYTAADAHAANAEVARRRRTHIPDDLPPGDRKRREVRAEFIERVLAMVGLGGAHARLGPDVDGKSDTLLARALAEVSGQMADELQGIGLWDRRKKESERWQPPIAPPSGKPGDEPPDKPVVLVDQSTYYRWRAKYEPEDKRGLEGEFAARGNRNQLPPIVRTAMHTVMSNAIEQARDKRQIGKVATITMAQIRSKIDDALKPERLRTPELADKLVVPSPPTLHRHWATYPAFDRACATMGLSRARREFRFIRGHEHPEAPYELVEYDETPMPFVFIDEVRGVPLGKATFCAAIDVATHSLGGFTIGFDPFSDMTMMSTLRHAVCLKSYVSQDYGGRIRNEYLPGGMFRCIGIDNSQPAWGHTLKEVARTLDCDLMWLPPRTPWFKPIIENFFGLVTKLLLQELPGFALGRAIDCKDYDPKVNACIGLRQFLFLFHAWVIDIYQVRPQEELGHRSPNDRWRELLANGEPGLLDAADDVDSLFGVVREGVLDHRGVRFMNIRYGGPELEGLRLDQGAKRTILFKINPANLLHVMVYHPGLKDWVRGEAYRRDYADGLSLYVHGLVQAQIKRRGLEENEHTHIIGLADLKALIVESLPQAIELGSRQAIARALGVNSTHLIGGIDQFGRLPPPSGPWTGQTLNPCPDTARDPVPRDETPAPDASPSQAAAPGAFTTLVSDAAAPGASLAPRTVRPRRSFVADDSIAHVRLTEDRRR